ncbi:alcohol dehydrogenase-like regulatory protein ErcA [Fundidesulfovibrio agrisoli]|uniref:alcohol dehydrogenase-like regulatory protein ErcA n=1 Tax=Fundidesulfovibrio agrisoli TaxID=2922717 RepID=UPI001FAB45B3|nr:alcohol dehydrogenase-like regulatory protein ErcA [Fundidesulfovibrio agrisoli]
MECAPGLELRKFVAPEFVFGLGASELAAQYAQNLGARRPMLVTDQGVVDIGWAGMVEASLRAAGLDCVVFSNVTANPKDYEVMAAAEIYRDKGCDALVGLGGGSAMDCAKGVGVVQANGGNILDYEGVDTVPRALPPLVCVPTTSGSSADVSQFAIISDTKRKVKIALVSKMLVPDVSLIDPRLTATMSPDLTANTGLDALTHAIEAYVSNASAPVTDLFALEAVRLVGKHLPQAVADPSDMEARTQMCLASLDAGLAFSNAILGAVHGMAHSLGGLLDLPHGQCNAILLAPVVRFNFHSAPLRYRDIAVALGCDVPHGADNEVLDALDGALRSLNKSVGMGQTLGDLGVTREEIPRLAELAMQDPCLLTNPRKPSKADIEAIYESAL